MKRIAGVLVLVFVVVPVGFIVDQAVRTLNTLTNVERERDTWQRPDEIIRHLTLDSGDTAVDLGSGAGYFALKLAPRVGPGGRVLAVDLRSQSLAFLWIRATLAGYWNLDVIRGEVDDPKLSPGTVDAVLMANTYHELTAPEAILTALFMSMRPGARLVVVDRGPREGGETHTAPVGHHEITSATAELGITQQGFQTLTRVDRFIDRPEDEDLWWLIVFRRP